MRAFASHQCGPGSILGPGVICWSSLLLVLVLAPRVFLRVLQFSFLHKNQHSQFHFDRDSERHRFVRRKTVTCNRAKSIYFLNQIYDFQYRNAVLFFTETRSASADSVVKHQVDYSKALLLLLFRCLRETRTATPFSATRYPCPHS